MEGWSSMEELIVQVRRKVGGLRYMYVQGLMFV